MASVRKGEGEGTPDALSGRVFGGPRGTRTPDILLVRQAL